MTAQRKAEPFVWPIGLTPRHADGSVDVRAYCRELDDFFNRGLEPARQDREAP